MLAGYVWKPPRWLWLTLVVYVLVHFDVWLALVLFKRCPGEVSFGDIFTQPPRSPKSSQYFQNYAYQIRQAFVCYFEPSRMLETPRECSRMDGVDF